LGVRYLKREVIPYYVVGKGSNILVTDGGFKGVVILLGGSLAAIGLNKNEGHIVMAGGGMAITDLLKHCLHKGLGGLEFLAGIPGTVGGAVAVNAGAWGKDIGGAVQEIELLDEQGDLHRMESAAIHFAYRSASLPASSIIIRVRFELQHEKPEIVLGRIDEFMKKRKASQPLNYPNAGSIFKNPPNDHAGKLIERAGLKGKRIGGAMISHQHANFILNTGGASAKDILSLMALARQKVREQMGIELEPEIKVVGE